MIPAIIALALCVIFLSVGCLALLTEVQSLKNYVGLMAQQFEIVEVVEDGE